MPRNLKGIHQTFNTGSNKAGRYGTTGELMRETYRIQGFNRASKRQYGGALERFALDRVGHEVGRVIREVALR